MWGSHSYRGYPRDIYIGKVCGIRSPVLPPTGVSHLDPVLIPPPRADSRGGNHATTLRTNTSHVVRLRAVAGHGRTRGGRTPGGAHPGTTGPDETPDRGRRRIPRKGNGRPGQGPGGNRPGRGEVQGPRPRGAEGRGPDRGGDGHRDRGPGDRQDHGQRRAGGGIRHDARQSGAASSGRDPREGPRRGIGGTGPDRGQRARGARGVRPERPLLELPVGSPQHRRALRVVARHGQWCGDRNRGHGPDQPPGPQSAHGARVRLPLGPVPLAGRQRT